MNREIGIEEARKTLGDLVTRVQYTRELITITRNGKPAAVLAPIQEPTMETIADIAPPPRGQARRHVRRGAHHRHRVRRPARLRRSLRWAGTGCGDQLRGHRPH